MAAGLGFFPKKTGLFFEQIKEKTSNHSNVIRLRQANPLDKFQRERYPNPTNLSKALGISQDPNKSVSNRFQFDKIGFEVIPVLFFNS
jgi:hypothetical protein